MQPHMSRDDMLMFYRYLAKSKSYFEFGSGGSTYQASIRENNKRIVSVESDFEWHTKLKSLIKNPLVQFIYCDIKTVPNTWGNPGEGSTVEDWRKYSGAIQTYGDKEIDLILIDGRFRVACCLNCFDVISDTCLIAFDDFLDRPPYHIVLDFYEIVERTKDTRMVILRKKSVASPPRELIEKYEFVRD
jgi:protein O-GlcNAc transferase